MLRTGSSICCAVGIGSKVGAPVPGSGPKLVNGFCSAGLVTFGLGWVVGVVTGAVGSEGSAQGCGLEVVTGLGDTKSRTVGAYCGFAWLYAVLCGT